MWLVGLRLSEMPTLPASEAPSGDPVERRCCQPVADFALVTKKRAPRKGRARNGLNGHSQVLTLEEAAEYLRISKAHLSNLINGKVAGAPCLRCARIGRRIVIKREWANEWLEKVGQE